MSGPPPPDAVEPAPYEVPLPPRDAELERACLPVARQLLDAGVTSLGLIPAGDEAAVPPVALLVGRMLAARPGASAAVVDANFLRPAFPPIHGEAPEGDLDAPRLHPLEEDLVLAQPRPLRAGDTLLDALAPALAWLRGRVSHLIVDLTGFDRLGEEERALGLLEGAAVVARAGRTAGETLAAVAARIPPGRDLGVLLVG